MTKRDIVKWLEQKREEALENADKQYEEAMKQHNEKLYKEIGLRETADEIEKHLNAAREVYSKWKNKIKEGVVVTNYYGSSIGDTIQRPLNANNGVYGWLIERDIRDETNEKDVIYKRYRGLLKGINKNYDNLILAVKSTKNAKMSCDYLKEIGFDVTNIEVKEESCTALVTDIDTSYLFIQPVAR